MSVKDDKIKEEEWNEVLDILYVKIPLYYEGLMDILSSEYSTPKGFEKLFDKIK